MSTEPTSPTKSKRGRMAATAAAAAHRSNAEDVTLTPGVAPVAHLVELLPLPTLFPSPLNPRKAFDQAEIAKLAESIRVKGVIEPILVRPLPGEGPDDVRREIVFGECRWRASKLAGMTTIPAMTRVLTDQEVLELQLVENGKRNDITPLEEADAFACLRDRFKMTPEQIAAKVSKSVDTVKRRLALCDLSDAARKSFTDGVLPLRTAEQLAALPEEVRPRALKELLEQLRYGDRESITVRDGLRVLRGFTLALSEAQFDRGDATLVPAAGACTACPKRTSAQADLFAGAEEKGDRCTDKVCWDSKLDALWQIRRNAAVAKGVTVMPDAEAKKLLTTYDGNPQHGAKYVDLEQDVYVGSKYQSYKRALGKNAPPVTLARDSAGRIHELVHRSDAEKVLGVRSTSSTSSSHLEANERKRRAEEKVRSTVAARVVEAVVHAAEKAKLTDELIRVVILGMIARAWNDTLRRIVSRRKIEVPKGHNQLPKVLAEVVDEMGSDELRGFLVELSVASFVGGNADYRDATTGSGKQALSVLRVDAKKIEADVRAELKEAAATKAKPKAPAKKAKRADV